MHVDSPSSHRMWLNDLYIHVAAPSQEQLDQVQASPSAAPELRHRSLCTEMSLPVGNRSLSDVSTGHCENVPKLLEIASGKVWASYVTMQGNGGSVMGLSVGLGATLYMESAHVNYLLFRPPLTPLKARQKPQNYLLLCIVVYLPVFAHAVFTISTRTVDHQYSNSCLKCFISSTFLISVFGVN